MKIMGLPNFPNMQLFLWVFHLVLIECFSSSSSLSLPYTSTVRTNNGFIRGILRHTLYKSIPYYSYMGIPYAKPPVGNLMFKVLVFYLLSATFIFDFLLIPFIFFLIFVFLYSLFGFLFPI